MNLGPGVVAAPGGHGWVASRWHVKTVGAGTAALRITLAVYSVIVVTKLHELLPGMAKLYPAKVVGAVLLLIAAFVVPARHFAALLRATPTRWLGVTAALGVLSVPFALWPGGSFQFLTHLYWKNLLFFVVAGAAWLDRDTLHQSIVGVVGGATVIALALVLRVSGAASGRFYAGPTNDPNETALLLLVVIPFALYLASSAHGRSRVLWYASAMALVGGIARTASRGGLLGLLVLGAWLLYRATARQRVRYLAALLLATTAFALAVDETSWQRFVTLVEPTADYNYTYREGRVEIWKRGLNYVAMYPFLGVGIDNFPIAEGVLAGKRNEGYGIPYSAAHNSFIQIAAELGIPGFIAFVSMLWTAAAGCRRIRAQARRRDPGAAVASEMDVGLANAGLDALVVWLVVGSLLSFAYDVVTLFIMAFCVAVWTGSPLALNRLRSPRAWGP